MEAIRTLDAAARLGVSDRQIRYLVERGDLVSPERGWVSVASLDAHVARHGDVKARVWEPRTAWAAIELLTGGTAEWLGSSQRSRLRKALLTLDVESVVSRLRNRADVRTYQFDPDQLELVFEQVTVIRSGDGAVDGYVGEQTLQHVIAEAKMVRRGTGNLVARVLSDEIGQDFVEAVASHGQVVVGVDLAGSTQSQERALGMRIVSQALNELD